MRPKIARRKRIHDFNRIRWWRRFGGEQSWKDYKDQKDEQGVT
jgi:hypothetical protein